MLILWFFESNIKPKNLHFLTGVNCDLLKFVIKLNEENKSIVVSLFEIHSSYVDPKSKKSSR